MNRLLTVITLVLGLSSAAMAQLIGVSGAGDVNDSTSLAQQNIPSAAATLPPFGHNLFTGGFASERESGLNPDYVVSEGDQIMLRIWGATEVNEQLTVDTQGNIFIPKVGPVRVGGVRNSQLNERVSQAVRGVFTNNVRVYTTLNSAQPVAVFVTGFVTNPGRYAGVASNSILYFIDRAGGIDELRGSYRDVRLLRNGGEVARADLYDFLLDGRLTFPQMRDGDTVVVGPRGNTVMVRGDVRNAFTFELTGETLTGEELMSWARPLAKASHAQWRGYRGGAPAAEYDTLARFATLPLRDGDAVEVISDHRANSIVVTVEGNFNGPSQYVLPRHFVLADLLDLIPVDPDLSNYRAISIRRTSVAERQRQSLEDSLRRLESAYLLASSSTNEEAQIRARETEMIASFVQRARQVEPNGRLVLAADVPLESVTLEDGDVITIPQRTQTVLVSGEVLVPQAMLHQAGLRTDAYVARAGGYSDRANPARTLVIRQNGEVLNNSRNMTIEPGDQLMVLPEVPTKNLQAASQIIDVIYKVAISAGVLIAL